MKKIILIISLIISMSAYAQDNVGIGTINPDPSALLDLTSNNKGVLLPRLNTSQRNTITNPAQGLIVYNTDSLCFEFFQGTWQSLCNIIGSGSTTIINNFDTTIVNNTFIQGDTTIIQNFFDTTIVVQGDTFITNITNTIVQGDTFITNVITNQFIFSDSVKITELSNTIDTLKSLVDSLAFLISVYQQDTIGIPRGIITALAGTVSIPSGWALCDGTNGTPDLRGKFIRGQDTLQPSGIINNMLAGDFKTKSMLYIVYGAQSSQNSWVISDTLGQAIIISSQSIGSGHLCCNGISYQINLDGLPPGWYAFTALDAGGNGWTNSPTNTPGNFRLDVLSPIGGTSIPITYFTSNSGSPGALGTVYSVKFFIPDTRDKDTYALRYIMKL